MLKWLAKKNQNARAYMCIKEVSWELQRADPVKRAKILLLAQFLRISIVGRDGVPLNMINRPLECDRVELLAVYESLEITRNKMRLTESVTRRNQRKIFGEDLPGFLIEHSKAVERGLEVWMCTIGAGIAADRREDVQMIWTNLTGARDHIPEAIQQLQKVEQGLEQMTGGGSGTFSNIAPGEWLELCKFVPSTFDRRSTGTL